MTLYICSYCCLSMSTVAVEVIGSIATITFNRPRSLNAIRPEGDEFRSFFPTQPRLKLDDRIRRLCERPARYRQTRRRSRHRLARCHFFLILNLRTRSSESSNGQVVLRVGAHCTFRAASYIISFTEAQMLPLLELAMIRHPQGQFEQASPVLYRLQWIVVMLFVLSCSLKPVMLTCCPAVLTQQNPRCSFEWTSSR